MLEVAPFHKNMAPPRRIRPLFWVFFGPLFLVVFEPPSVFRFSKVFEIFTKITKNFQNDRIIHEAAILLYEGRSDSVTIDDLSSTFFLHLHVRWFWKNRRTWTTHGSRYDFGADKVTTIFLGARDYNDFTKCCWDASDLWTIIPALHPSIGQASATWVFTSLFSLCFWSLPTEAPAAGATFD